MNIDNLWYNGIFEQLTGPNEDKFSYRVMISPKFSIEKILQLESRLEKYVISFNFYAPAKHSDYWLVYFCFSVLTKHKTQLEDKVYLLLRELFT